MAEDYRIWRRWGWLAVTLAALLLTTRVLAGPPGFPHWLAGTVTLDGVLATDGVRVQCLTRGTPVITATVFTTGGDAGLYSVGVPADDTGKAGVQGGVAGDAVTFAVQGYEMAPTATWTSEKIQELPLHNGPFTYTFAADVLSDTTDVVFLAHDGGPGLVINANGRGLGATSIRIRANQVCTNAPVNSAHRCFEISPTHRTGRDATLTFYFYSSQLPAGLSCAEMNAYRWTGSAWQSLTRAAPPDCEHNPHSLRVSNVTDFSHFILGKEPNAVTLQTFAAGRSVGWWSFLAWCGLSAWLLRRRRDF